MLLEWWIFSRVTLPVKAYLLEIIGSWGGIWENPSILESNNTFLHTIDEPIIMRCYENCFPFFIEFFKKKNYFSCIFWIKVACRFIAEDNSWIMYKRSSNSRALEFTAREWFNIFIFLLKKSYLWENFRYSLSDGRIRVPTYFHGERDIFVNSFFWEQFEVLKYDTDTSSICEQLSFREVAQLHLIISEYISFTWRNSSNYWSNKTCLPASWCSDEKYKFARMYSDIEISQDGPFAIGEWYMWEFHK